MNAIATKPIASRLEPGNFERISDIIRDTVGIKLNQQKLTMVEGRLRKRMRSLGFDDANEYCRYVLDGEGQSGEFVHLVDAITTNKTDFFRERDHFELLRTRMVPDLLKLRKGAKAKLKVWSAASSNGSEAWSLAMVLHDMAAEGSPLDFAILGTDISVSVLEAARTAVYPADAVEPVPDHLRQRYTLVGVGGRQSGHVRIAPELRARAHFEQMNLMDRAYPYDTDVDIIFLRNVLIYFEREDQEAVVERLIGHLRPGGFFAVGHSESMVVIDPRVEQIAPAVFQRVR